MSDAGSRARRRIAFSGDRGWCIVNIRVCSWRFDPYRAALVRDGVEDILLTRCWAYRRLYVESMKKCG